MQQLRIRKRMLLMVFTVMALTISSRLLHADTGTCGGGMFTLPFSDVPSSNIFFCSIAAAYFSGLTNGSTPTTFSPGQNVPREQMAAFITRTLDQSLRRGNRRAALGQWWTPGITGALRTVEWGAPPSRIVCDGADVWVTIPLGGVLRIEASSGRVKENWKVPGTAEPIHIIAAAGRVFIVASPGPSPASIYVINPDADQGNAILFEDSIGALPQDLTFDGTFLWTANAGAGLPGTQSISRIRVSDAFDTSFSTGFSFPVSILWDGAALWVLDRGPDPDDDALKEVNPSTGSVISVIPVPEAPREMIFDGMNLWISHSTGSTVTVVRAVGALKGTVLQNITGNGLNGCFGMAFDGERVLVANQTGNSVSLFKAADFTPLGSLSTGAATAPLAACSDGLNFWITLPGSNDIVKF